MNRVPGNHQHEDCGEAEKEAGVLEMQDLRVTRGDRNEIRVFLRT